ncbi:helix-turn-helix domain-containing protein [Streptomyces sp. NBC_00160]|uniref:helix-turn-helix domain-containing protein n=1 Tax=Streptomyces sp. NBC_00160 TaxID=2903628 RepID=UPI00224DCF2A|nr:helix-turn-helix domain-containing protein [Streptomyces sp. NBC_00160]MCX5308902.1 helix-turn-helix domain-containing protein [Streptomyces sp. NBC_00160]
MPTTEDSGSTGTGALLRLRELLDLLDRGAPAEAFQDGEPSASDAASAAEAAVIADATRTALRIRRTLSQHRRREAELAALFDTAGDLARLREPDAVLAAIVHRAKLLLGTDVTYLSLNDEAAGDTYMRVTDGSVSAAFQRVRLGMGEGLGGLVAETARPYSTGDYREDRRFRHTTTIDSAVTEEGLRAILGVPLRLGTRVIGVLYAADRTARTFTPDEVALLASLADHAAIAIDGARLLDETRTALVDLNAASRTIEAHSEAMRRAEDAHDRLTDLVLRGGDVTDVATAIGAVLQGGTLVHDAEGAELARAGTGPRPPSAQAVAASRAGGRAVFADGTWVCAVLAGHELLGSIALTGRADLDDADRRLFERASLVTALLLLLRRSVAETEDRIRGELLGDLLTRAADPAGLSARARRLGVDLGRPHAVFVLHAGSVPRPRLLAAAARVAQARKGLAGPHHEDVVLVCPADAPGPGPAAASLASELSQALAGPVTVGAAGPVTGPAEFTHAYAEARRCRTALRALGREGTGAALHDLGFLGVLLGDQTDLGGYVRQTLGPVLAYDAKRGTDLTRTLRAYFDEGASRTRAAEVLHVHVNTVVQRLDRIGSLLGRDWQRPERALELQLALRIHRVNRHDGPGQGGFAP